MRYHEFKDKITEWKNPKEWVEDFGFCGVSSNSGVYMIVEETGKQNPRILYIGRAKNLKKRYTGHEVLKITRELLGSVSFYYLETSDYVNKEKEMIREFHPRLNKHRY